MTQDLVKKEAEENRIAAFGGLMDEAPVAATDILMPTLLLMQQMSKLVVDEKAKSGEYRDSLEGKLLAGKGEAVEVIPFGFHKTWVRFSKKDGQQVFEGIEPFTAQNANRPREEIVEGVDYQNFETINYYVLIPEEIKSGVFLPYLIRFRSTGYMAGKRMETFRAKMAEFKKPHCFSTFLIGAEQVENAQKQKYWRPTVANGRDTTDAELSAVKHWSDMVKAGRVKADDSDLKGSASEAAAAPGATSDFEC